MTDLDSQNSRRVKKIHNPQSSSIEAMDPVARKRERRRQKVLQEDNVAHEQVDTGIHSKPRRKKRGEEMKNKTTNIDATLTVDAQDGTVPSLERKKKRRAAKGRTTNDHEIEESEVFTRNIAKKDNSMATDKDDDVADLENREHKKGRDGKKGKKRKEYHLTPSAALSHYSEADYDADLNLSAEDVVTDKNQHVEFADPPNLVPSLPSQPLDVVYIERADGGGFRKINKHNFSELTQEKSTAEMENRMNNITSSAQLGSSVFNVFMRIALFCEGILAGFALWQMTTIFTFDSEKCGFIAIFTYYSKLSRAVQSLYYFLLAIATVSVIDRFDLDTHEYITLTARIVRSPLLFVTILIYFASLILSTSIAEIDFRISYYSVNQSYWVVRSDQCSYKLTTQSEALYSSWKILNLLRAVFAILGWILVSFNPITKVPEKFLYGRNRDILGEEVKDLRQKTSSA